MSYDQKPPGHYCRHCNAETAGSILSNFGAMCEGCYRAYCRRPLVATPDIGDKAGNGPRDWIRAMKQRERNRESLTPFQRQAWRDAAAGKIGVESEA